MRHLKDYIYIIYSLTYKVIKDSIRIFSLFCTSSALKGYLIRKKVNFQKDICLRGKMIININKEADVCIGRNFICNGRGYGIDSGSDSHIVVGKGAKLFIGNNTGCSGTSIHCYEEITIGNYVNIGAGTKIFDTDFHSLAWKDRENIKTDIANRKTAPIHIGDHVFIGTRTIIGKGVTIGDRSIIAAGSVVVTNIPSDEIWGGNPAVFIKKQ